MTFENTPVIASGGLEEDYAQFFFCSRWDGFEKTAVFWRTEAEVYHVLLDEDGSCEIPPEVTAEDGTIYFGVFGVDAAGRRRTSEVLTYHIVKGAIVAGENPTLDIYTQLLAQYAEMRDIAAETKAAEESFEQEIRDMIEDGLVPDGAINAVKLADQAVTTEKLADQAVTAEKLADGAVDAYTRAEALTPETKALYGLGADAVPDAAMAYLGKYNQHWWGKTSDEIFTQATVEVYNYYFITNSSYGINFYAADSYTFDATTGQYTLVNPTFYEDYGYGKASGVWNDAVLGKYILLGSDLTATGQMIYVPATASMYSGSKNVYVKTGATVLYGAAPSVRQPEFYWSPDRNAYSESDGYKYLGVPFTNAARVPRIETGYYYGNGQYGESNANSLVFDFEPKLIIIRASGSDTLVMVNPGPVGGAGYNAGTVSITWGTTVSWYSTTSAAYQHNGAGGAYYYFAIG